MIFSQIPSDFRRLRFIGLDLYNTIEIVSVPVTTTEHWLGELLNHESPEKVAVDTIGSFEVSQDLIKPQLRPSINGHEIYSTPAKVTYFMKVKIDIENIQYLRSVRSVVSNLAGNYRFYDDSRVSGGTSHSLDGWELVVDENDKTKGYITSSIEIFGISDNELNVKMLKLHIQLKDKDRTEVNETFVIDKFIEIDNTKMEVKLNLKLKEPLPEVVIEGADGGFDAEIGGWEDDVIQDVEI